MPTIESLELEVSSNASSASANIDRLKESLTKLGSACAGAVSGMQGTADKINQLGVAVKSLSGSDKLVAFAEGLKSLAKVRKLNIDASVATTIMSLNDAVERIDSGATYMLHPLADGLSALSKVGNIRLSPDLPQTIETLVRSANTITFMTAGNLGTLANGLRGLQGLGSIKINSDLPNNILMLSDALALFDTTGLEKIPEIAGNLAQLGNLGKSNLGTLIDQLKRLPEVATAMSQIDINTFTEDLKKLSTALAPLAGQLTQVASAISTLPKHIDKVEISATKATNMFSKLGSGIKGMLVNFVGISSLSNLLAVSVKRSQEYVENYNLFTVAMGEYADQAERYAEKVSQVLGIDPSAWMREQGVFMTLVSGFGVAGDKAYIMSQNLTQLGYDIASFFNIDVATAMQKVESGIAGELEPLRRLGYDLSETRLKAIALELGITKSYQAMTQAEKSQLRYYAMLNQVTTAQGDMARTINSPANQMRILKTQVEMLTRALGDLFIPILNQVLPYVIAFTKAIRNLITAINALFSGKKDGASGINSVSASMKSLVSETQSASAASSELANNAMGYDEVNALIEGATDGTGAFASETAAAKKEVEKLTKSVMGFDELNMIADTEITGGGGGGGGGGDDPYKDDFDIEPPSYDFLGDAINNEVDKIYSKLEPIITWITDHMETVKGIVEGIGILIAGWKLNKFIKGLGNVEDWLGKIGTLLGGMVTAVLTVTFSYIFSKKYLDDGNAVNLILSGLTSILGSLLTSKLIAKGFGGKAGGVAGSITLALAAVADIYAKYGNIKENGFNGRTILTDVLAAFKGALAGVALAKVLKLSTTGLATGGLIGLGITFMISGLVGLSAVSMKDDSGVTGVWVNSLWTTVGGAITGVGIAKALSLSIASGGVIGGVIGFVLAAAVTLAKISVESTEYNAVPGWGDITKSAEEIETLIKDLFDIDFEAHIEYTKTTTENLTQAVTDVNTTIDSISDELNKLEIGGEIDPDTWSAVKDSLFNEETGLIPSLRSQLAEEANQLEISVGILPPLDSEGNLIDNLFPDANALDTELSAIGKTMATLLSKGITTGLTGEEEFVLSATRDFINRVNYRLKEDDIKFDFGMKMDDLLGSLSRESMGDALSTYKQYKNDLKAEYTDLALEQKRTLEQQKVIYEEMYNYYVEIGDPERAAAVKETLDTINYNIENWDLDASVNGALDSITGPGEESLKNSLITIFQKGFADSKFDDYAAEYQHYWQTSLGDEIKNMSTGELSNSWGEMIEKMVKDSMSDADYEVFLDAKDMLHITEWDVLSDSTKKELIASMTAAVGAEETKKILADLGYDVTDLIADGANSNSALAGMEQAGKDAVGAVNNGVEKTDVTPVEVGVDLEKGNWLHDKDVSGWVGGFIGEAVGAVVDLTKGNWKNTTVGKWISDTKDNIGDTVKEKVDLVKNGWTTVFGWTTGTTKNFGGNVKKDVDLEKGNWKGKNVGTWITNISDNFGGAVEKKVDLEKNGWETVSGWLSSVGNSGGDVQKPVGLTKNFGTGIGTVLGWLGFKNYLGGDVEKPVVPTFGFGTVLAWFSQKKLLGGDVNKTVNLVKGDNWKKGIDSFIIGKGQWKHDYTINLKKGSGKLTWLPSVHGAVLEVMASGGMLDAGQMFVAREAGPELVGSIGSRTAVVNNDQIVEAVSLGVYQAVSAAMSTNSNSGEDARIVINLDGKTIYENQQKIARGRGVNLGMGAYSYGG